MEVKIKYSAISKGFYRTDIIYPNPPADLVEITDQKHSELLAAQSNGKIITADDNGNPIAIDPPAPTREQKLTSLRAERDRRLSASDFTQLPDAPYTAAQKTAWQTYRQALRDMPEQTDLNLDDPQWPVIPSLG